MRRVLMAAAVSLGLLIIGPATRAQPRTNKISVRQVEAALVMDSGALKVRLTLVTGEALDYEIKDDGAVTNVLKFIEVSANGNMQLAAEISTDGHTLRALHLAPGTRVGR
jgi:hypothetical protein